MALLLTGGGMTQGEGLESGASASEGLALYLLLNATTFQKLRGVALCKRLPIHSVVNSLLGNVLAKYDANSDELLKREVSSLMREYSDIGRSNQVMVYVHADFVSRIKRATPSPFVARDVISAIILKHI